MKKRMKQILLGLLVAVFMICIPASEVGAASALALIVNGKEQLYARDRQKC